MTYKKLQLGDRENTALVSADKYNEVIKAGPWRLNRQLGYVVSSKYNKETKTPETIYLHRFVMNLQKGDGKIVDHINGDRLDCRNENLRLVTKAENAQNRTRAVGALKFRGVSKRENGRYRISVQIPNGGGRIRKQFKTELEAAFAAEALRAKYQPMAQPDPELAKYADLKEKYMAEVLDDLS